MDSEDEDELDEAEYPDEADIEVAEEDSHDDSIDDGSSHRKPAWVLGGIIVSLVIAALWAIFGF
jgi:hypothetical protein